MYPAMMTRACRSPAMSIRSVHPARAVRTNLSAIALDTIVNYTRSR
jgi:hypothetical protein